MDGGTLLGALLGFVLGFLADYGRHRFALAQDRTEAVRTEEREALVSAYWPALVALERMIGAYPDHQAAREQLRQVFEMHGAMFTVSEREHLHAALAEYAVVDDIVIVRDSIDRAIHAKQAAASRR
jgi:hypothetical protein